MFHALWSTVQSLATGPAAGQFAVGLGVLVAIHSALGIGRAGRGYLLPVLFGLIVLAGFLLNPFADASTPQDLRDRLTSAEALTLLCIAQFLIAVASVTLGVRLDAPRRMRGGLWLAVLHVVPAPMLLVAMLVVAQTWLVALPGRRPEAAGWIVGLAAAGLTTALAGLALTLPDHWLAAPHRLLGVALLLACMLLPNLQQTLPAERWEVDWASLVLCLEVGLGAAVVVALGWLGRRIHVTLRVRPAADVSQ